MILQAGAQIKVLGNVPSGVRVRRAHRAPQRGRVVRAEEGDLVKDLQQDEELMSLEELEKKRKKEEADRLRAQEKFMVVSSGKADCTQCGYVYDPAQGDPEFPVAKGTKFDDLPQDWVCPVCNSTKQTFQVDKRELAGFAVNQGYGLGTNSMTGDEKNRLIFGTLAFFVVLFLSGYLLD
ncbi:unnamed protein product [Pedinophyceae sp. YPF-701]|nr:unnamed protein product [Pedinophyceae sp. YPF-701]